MAIRANAAELFDNNANTTNVNLAGWDNGRTIALKSTNGKELYLFVNPKVADAVSIATPANLNTAAYHLVSASYGVTPTLNGTSVTLPAGAYAVYATTNVSGLDEATIDTEAAPMIYVDGNSIKVEGYEADRFAVYNLAGVKVNPDAVAPGVYIVTTGTHTAKIAVR